jgi:hypothetical protein
VIRCRQRWRVVCHLTCAGVVCALLARAAAAQAQQVTVGRNVQVSRANSTDSHDEVLISADPVNPRRLLACSIVMGRANIRAIAYVSFDGGVLWTPAVEHSGWLALADDPSCALGLDGHAYFSTIPMAPPVVGHVPDMNENPNYPRVSFSTDGAKTWHDAVVPGGNKRGVDRDYIVEDTTNSKYRGRVYLYMQLHGPALDGGGLPSGIALWHSTDGGATFNGPIQTFPPDDTTCFWLAGSVVLSDGTFAALAAQVIYQGDLHEGTLGYKQGELKLVTSSDGGKTFNPAVKISDIYDHWTDANIASIAADTQSTTFRDRLYAAWSDGRSGGRKHILLSYSADKGKTWSPPRRVDDDNRLPYGGLLRNAGMPAVAVNKDGVVGVSWYDRRDNESNDMDYMPRFAASFDGGETFTPSAQVSERPRVLGQNEEWIPISDQNLISSIGVRFNPLAVGFKITRREWPWGGDTAGLAATADGIFHPLWIDNRTGIHQMWTAPVTVAGTVAQNGSPELARMKDVSGQCVLQITELSYDRRQNLMIAKVQVKNASKEVITGLLKLRATELYSPVGQLEVVNAENHASAVGAVWDFSSSAPPEGLVPYASTQSVELRFKFVKLYADAFVLDKKFQRDWINFNGHVLAKGQ